MEGKKKKRHSGWNERDHGEDGSGMQRATPSRRDPGRISGAFVAAAHLAQPTGAKRGPHREQRGPVESRIQRASAGIRRWGWAKEAKLEEDDGSGFFPLAGVGCQECI